MANQSNTTTGECPLKDSCMGSGCLPRGWDLASWLIREPGLAQLERREIGLSCFELFKINKCSLSDLKHRRWQFAFKTNQKANWSLGHVKEFDKFSHATNLINYRSFLLSFGSWTYWNAFPTFCCNKVPAPKWKLSSIIFAVFPLQDSRPQLL